MKQLSGGVKLCLLGVLAALTAVCSTVISLKIYHDTGDIYLDRSRPGFIFEDEKTPSAPAPQEVFSENGDLNADTIREYLQLFDASKAQIDSADKFSPDILSDEKLNLLPAETPAETPADQPPATQAPDQAPATQP